MFAIELVTDGTLAPDEARSKWDKEVRAGAMKMKTKGNALFLHAHNKENRCVLHYYKCYGKDFCDATFTGEISEYDTGCQITGKVTAPSSLKRFGWILIALSIPLAFVLNIALQYVLFYLEYAPKIAQDDFSQFIFNFIAILLVLNSAAVMCFVVDKRRVSEIMSYLHKFLQEDSQ